MTLRPVTWALDPYRGIRTGSCGVSEEIAIYSNSESARKTASSTLTVVSLTETLVGTACLDRSSVEGTLIHPGLTRCGSRLADNDSVLDRPALLMKTSILVSSTQAID